MKIAIANQEHESMIIALLQQSLSKIPPYVTQTSEELIGLWKKPTALVDLHFPPREEEIVTYVTVDGIHATAQIAFPAEDEEASLLWIAGEGEQESLHAFVSAVLALAQERGYTSIHTAKNPFGIGWEGVADAWPDMLQACLNAGFSIQGEWIGYWLDGELERKELPADFQLSFERDLPNGEVSIFLHHQDEQVGEINLWLPPALSTSLVAAGIADLEFIEIDEKLRGKRLGQALITAALDELAPLGYSRLMLWTEPDNNEMINLATRSGFTQGPTFHWMQAAL